MFQLPLSKYGHNIFVFYPNLLVGLKLVNKQFWRINLQKISNVVVGRYQSSRWNISAENQLVQGLEDTNQWLEKQYEDQLPIFGRNG